MKGIIVSLIAIVLLLTGCAQQSQPTTFVSEEQSEPTIGYFADYTATFPYIETARGGTVVRNGSPIQRITRNFRYAQTDNTKVLTFTDGGPSTQMENRYIVEPDGSIFCEHNVQTGAKSCVLSDEAAKIINQFQNLMSKEKAAFTYEHTNPITQKSAQCFQYSDPSYNGLRPYTLDQTVENTAIDFTMCIDKASGLLVNATALIPDQATGGNEPNNELRILHLGIITESNKVQNTGIYAPIR